MKTSKQLNYKIIMPYHYCCQSISCMQCECVYVCAKLPQLYWESEWEMSWTSPLNISFHANAIDNMQKHKHTQICTNRKSYDAMEPRLRQFKVLKTCIQSEHVRCRVVVKLHASFPLLIEMTKCGWLSRHCRGLNFVRQEIEQLR